MWRLILLAFVMLSPVAKAQQVVRVVTWNLKWFPGGSPNASEEAKQSHITEVAAEICKLNPDVLVLQEVHVEREVDLATWFSHGAQRLTTHVVSTFKETFSGAVSRQQIAILSRFPADSAWAEAWKRGWANAPRGYVFARLQLDANHSICVYGLHLKSNLGDAVSNTSKREDATDQLLEHIGSQVRPTEPVIVCGDFNTSLDDSRFIGDSSLRKIQQAGFFWTFEGIDHSARVTVPAVGSYPDACFDHIFTRRLGRPVAQVKEASGSDHYPVVVDIVVE